MHLNKSWIPGGCPPSKMRGRSLHPLPSRPWSRVGQLKMINEPTNQRCLLSLMWEGWVGGGSCVWGTFSDLEDHFWSSWWRRLTRLSIHCPIWPTVSDSEYTVTFDSGETSSPVLLNHATDIDGLRVCDIPTIKITLIMHLIFFFDGTNSISKNFWSDRWWS